MDHTFLESLQQYMSKSTEKKKNTFSPQQTMRVEKLWQFPNLSSREFKCNPACDALAYKRLNTLNFGNAIFLAGQLKCYEQLEVLDFWTSGAHQDVLRCTIQKNLLTG